MLGVKRGGRERVKPASPKEDVYLFTSTVALNNTRCKSIFQN